MPNKHFTQIYLRYPYQVTASLEGVGSDAAARFVWLAVKHWHLYVHASDTSKMDIEKWKQSLHYNQLTYPQE